MVAGGVGCSALLGRFVAWLSPETLSAEPSKEPKEDEPSPKPPEHFDRKAYQVKRLSENRVYAILKPTKTKDQFRGTDCSDEGKEAAKEKVHLLAPVNMIGFVKRPNAKAHWRHLPSKLYEYEQGNAQVASGAAHC